MNGGFRKLITGTSTIIDPFIGQPAEKSMMFRFDFRKPVHCRLDDVACTTIAFNVTKDVTKVDYHNEYYTSCYNEIKATKPYSCKKYLSKICISISLIITQRKL